MSTVQPAMRTKTTMTIRASPKLRFPSPMITPAEIPSNRFFGLTAESKKPSPSP